MVKCVFTRFGYVEFRLAALVVVAALMEAAPVEAALAAARLGRRRTRPAKRHLLYLLLPRQAVLTLAAAVALKWAEVLTLAAAVALKLAEVLTLAPVVPKLAEMLTLAAAVVPKLAEVRTLAPARRHLRAHHHQAHQAVPLRLREQ